MTTAATGELPTWIERLPRRPLCDVPWVGRAAVLSDGNVNFCCYSDAVVGNVNVQPLREVWNGATMKRIRATLAKQHFPKECQSHSCPIFRGDPHSFLLDRMDGDRRVTHVEESARLAASRLEISPGSAARGQHVRIGVRLAYAGRWLAADLFVGVTLPDGRQVFLPELGDVALPFLRGVELSDGAGPVALDIVDADVDAAPAAGAHEICAALFVFDSNPNVAANCLWSARGRLVVTA